MSMERTALPWVVSRCTGALFCWAAVSVHQFVVRDSPLCAPWKGGRALLQSFISRCSRLVLPPEIFILFCSCANIFVGLERERGSGGEGKGTVVATTEQRVLRCAWLTSKCIGLDSGFITRPVWAQEGLACRRLSPEADCLPFPFLKIQRKVLN